MTAPTSKRKRFIIFVIFILLFLILIPVLVLYSTGYRLKKGLILESTGGVYVYYSESGVDVTVKGLPPQRTTIFAKSVLIQNLLPGEYEIDVSKQGYSYWKKNILISEKRVAEAYPFLILEPVATSSIPLSILPTVNKLFLATSTASTASTTSKNNNFTFLPSPADISTTTFTATSSENTKNGILWKDVYLYKENKDKGDEILALWEGENGDSPFYFCEEKNRLCDTTIIVTISKSRIKHFDFYPGRNDVIIYSNDDGVFITELDKRSEQNFVTLAKGKVDFRLYNGHIYIKDKGDVYEVIYN